jgi:hypothetical protein
MLKKADFRLRSELERGSGISDDRFFAAEAAKSKSFFEKRQYKWNSRNVLRIICYWKVT